MELDPPTLPGIRQQLGTRRLGETWSCPIGLSKTEGTGTKASTWSLHDP